MSIISSEAKWAVLQRVVRLSLEEIRGTTKDAADQLYGEYGEETEVEG